MAEFTLLKLDLDDASLTANAPFSGRERSDETEDTDSGQETGGRRLLPLVVGLVFLVAVAVIVRKRRGGSDEIETEGEEVIA